MALDDRRNGSDEAFAGHLGSHTRHVCKGAFQQGCNIRHNCPQNTCLEIGDVGIHEQGAEWLAPNPKRHAALGSSLGPQHRDPLHKRIDTQFIEQARFAYARLTANEPRRASAVLCCGEGIGKHAEFALAPDKAGGLQQAIADRC